MKTNVPIFPEDFTIVTLNEDETRLYQLYLNGYITKYTEKNNEIELTIIQNFDGTIFKFNTYKNGKEHFVKYRVDLLLRKDLQEAINHIHNRLYPPNNYQNYDF